MEMACNLIDDQVYENADYCKEHKHTTVTSCRILTVYTGSLP